MPNEFDLQIKWLNGSQIEIQANDAGALDGSEKVLIMQNDTPKETTTQDIADLGGGGVGYLVYKAWLTQVSTNAPTAVQLQNTIGNIVWTREEIGRYRGTLTAAFPEGKTVFPQCPSDASVIPIGSSSLFSHGFQAYRLDNNSVNLYFYNSDFDSVEWSSVLADTTPLFIEIQVYP